MKAKFFNWYNALAASLLSLLGFSSCGENGPWGDEPVLYGTPSTAFEAKGNITAEHLSYLDIIYIPSPVP